MSTAQVTQTITRDEVFTRHDYNVLNDGYKDQFYKRRVLLDLLMGHKIGYNGGKYMDMGVQLGSTAQNGSFSRGERGTLSDVNNETSAIFTPAYLRESRILFLQDEVEAGGDDKRKLGLAESKTKDSIERLLDLVLTQLSRTSKSASKDLNTLIEFITSDGTGAFGTLNPASAGQSAWANQFTGNFDFSAAGRATLRTLHNDASAGGKFGHDVVLLPQDFHEEWLEIADGLVSLNTEARLSTGHLTSNIAIDGATFYNRPVIWDAIWSGLQSAIGLMLDLRGVQLAIHPEYNLKASPWRSAEVDGIAARVSWLYLVCQLVGDSRRTQGYIGTMS